MSTMSIVENPDPFCNGNLRVLVVDEGRSIDVLALQRGEECLGDRVVPAVASAAHAARDSSATEGISHACSGELRALIRVKQQAIFRGRSASQGDAERLED